MPAPDDKHSRFRVSVLALMIAFVVAVFVLGRGPGSLVWITGASPSWLPFAGSLAWLHPPGQAGQARPLAAVSAAPSPSPTPSPSPDVATP